MSKPQQPYKSGDFRDSAEFEDMRDRWEQEVEQREQIRREIHFLCTLQQSTGRACVNQCEGCYHQQQTL
jgi:hypothetical protein